MRADRLISILLLLQVNRQMTARELASRLEVSERTIHRDMDALSGAGIPVVAERGNGGGWSLMQHYRTNLTGLNKPEIQALFLTTPSKLLADLGLEKASDAATIKLLAALPAASRADAEYARQRIHIDLSGWSRTQESARALPVIQEAVWRSLRLKFKYDRGPGCEPVDRLVEPLGMVAKGSGWYLVANVEGQTRSYRVSRIIEAESADEPFQRPQGFDLAEYWAHSQEDFKARLPRFDAVFRVAEATIPRLAYAGRFARVEDVGPLDSDGFALVRIRFQFESEAAECALSFGPQVEVVDPPYLKERIVALAKSVLDFYEKKF